MNIIDRPQYIDHIVRLLNKGMMIFLTGQRRVGKSFILKLVKQWLETNRPNANIVYINKELNQFGEIKTHDDLYTYAASKLPEGSENYLLIDEVQDVEGYQNALRSLYAEERCQIIATGSNAYIFSSSLATYLSGRYIEIHVHSLDYTEFLRFHNLPDDDSSLMKYMKFGGLPGLSKSSLDDENWVNDYLQGVFNTVILKDVIEREQIRNPRFISDLACYLADNAGKPFSVNSIVKYMKSVNLKITNESVSNYITALKSAFIIDEVKRFDIHGKELLDNLAKYYFTDNGLRNYLTNFNMRQSIEKVMENVVYRHLKCLGFKVNVGFLKVGEIDFVATKNDALLYIQVCYLLATEETMNRELGNLLKIEDNYPKYIVTMDPMTGGMESLDGVNHIHLREFLKTDFGNKQ